MEREREYAWISWVNDPAIEQHGLTFDRTVAKSIAAPAGQYRVCAYHLDFDERPTCYADVGSLAEAIDLCDHLSERCGRNVDYAVVFDDQGRAVHGGY